MVAFILLSALAAITSAQSDSCARTSVSGYCETISYTDLTTTSPSPPSKADCQDTCNGLFGDAGDWGCDLVGTLYHPTPLFFSLTNSLPRQAGHLQTASSRLPVRVRYVQNVRVLDPKLT